MRRAVVVPAVAQQQIDAEGAVAGSGGITAAEVRRAKRRLVRMLLAADAPGRWVEFDRDDEVTLWVWGRGYAVGTVDRLLGIEKKGRNSGFNGGVKHDARVGGKAG